jgi:hypothetical protein
MENIDHEGSLVFCLRMRDKWGRSTHKEEHKAQILQIGVPFLLRQFLMNMQRYEDVDLAPSKDILMTDMVYLQLNGDLQDFGNEERFA